MSSIQTLLNSYPGMESLIECQSVKVAFTEILLHHCGPLKRYVHTVWAALAFLAVVMVLLVLLWTRKVVHERNYHVSECTVKLHSIPANGSLEPGSAWRYPLDCVFLGEIVESGRASGLRGGLISPFQVLRNAYIVSEYMQRILTKKKNRGGIDMPTTSHKGRCWVEKISWGKYIYIFDKCGIDSKFFNLRCIIGRGKWGFNPRWKCNKCKNILKNDHLPFDPFSSGISYLSYFSSQ